MPALGADMEHGTVSHWYVKPGDRVKRGDLVAVISTDKGEIDVEVFEDGVIERLLAAPGDTLPVGAVLAVVGPGGAAVEAAPPPPPPPKAAPSAHRVAAELGVDLGVVTGTGPHGIIQRGDVERVARARAAGAERAARAEPADRAEPPEPAEPTEPAEPADRVRASPAARRRAQELGVDLATVKGTGPGGAVELADLSRPAAPAAEVPRAGDPQAGMRRAIAAAMSRANREIPHYHLETPVDMSRSLRWLEGVNSSRSARDRILPVVLLARGVVRALAEVPELNGFWRDDRHEPAEPVHLGFAIALRKGGLVTPAIRDAHRKTVPELMEALRDLIDRTRSGRLRGSELTDATITMTSLGDLGVETVHGVIYPPQVALVGFGRIAERPWAEGGMLGVRPVVTATLAGDHRATDGRAGARFLDALDRALQQPEEP